MVQAHEADYGQVFKHLQFQNNLTLTKATVNMSNENDGMAMNSQMLAVNWKSNSTIAVINANKPFAFSPSTPLIRGHTGAIYDIQWSPFEERLLATCADDGKVKMWVFDDFEGCKENLVEADMELEAHSRKCLNVRWHRSVESLLATCSIDKTVKIWDINEDRADEPAFTFAELADYATSVRWSPNGKLIASTTKDKKLVVIDPRQAQIIGGNACHAGPRQQRLEWSDDDTIITTGFDREAQRQWSAWDIRNLEQPLLQGPLGEGSGVPFFHFDREFKAFILCGRGDGVASTYIFDKSQPQMLTFLSQYVFPGATTQKAFSIAPKHAVDPSKQEILRGARATNKDTIEILNMTVPSRVGGFNQDYYLPFSANEPSS